MLRRIDADTNKVLGYSTLSAVAVEHADLPGKVCRIAPNPVLAVLMGRLSINEKTQGSGLGRFLVRDAILVGVRPEIGVGVESRRRRGMPQTSLHDPQLGTADDEHAGEVGYLTVHKVLLPPRPSLDVSSGWVTCS